MRFSTSTGDDFFPLCGVAFTVSGWDTLCDLSMWPLSLEAIGAFLHHTAQVVLAEDEGVAKAFCIVIGEYQVAHQLWL